VLWGLLAVALVLSMSTWFSASSVLPQLPAEWQLGTTAGAWLTIAVQLGFVAGALFSSLVNLADVRSARLVIVGGSFGAAAANLGLLAASGAGSAMWTWFILFAGDELYSDRADAAFVTFAVIAVGGLGCVAGGVAGDRLGRPETTAACMVLSGVCALSLGFVPHGLAIALVWGFAVVADSAQFSTLVTEHADQAYVGTALTLQLAVGFTLTVATIWLIPYLVDTAGWGLAFAFLAAGPALGVLAMLRLRSAG